MVLQLNTSTGEGYREIGETILDKAHANVPPDQRRYVLGRVLSGIAEIPDPIQAVFDALYTGTMIYNENVRIQNEQTAALFPPATPVASPVIPAPQEKRTLLNSFSEGFNLRNQFNSEDLTVGRKVNQQANIELGIVPDPHKPMRLQHRFAMKAGKALAWYVAYDSMKSRKKHIKEAKEAISRDNRPSSP